MVTSYVNNKTDNISIPVVLNWCDKLMSRLLPRSVSLKKLFIYIIIILCSKHYDVIMALCRGVKNHRLDYNCENT